MESPSKNDINNLKQYFKKVKQEVAAKVAKSGKGQAHDINIEGRTNLHFSTKIGQPGGTTHSSSIQNTRINQDNSL